MKRILALLLVLSAVLALAACSKSPAVTEDEGTTLVYGSGDYTRINPAMDEHGEINVLLFSGLTAHNGSNEVVAGLAESWEYDENACTYTFHLRDGVKWHDGEPFTAADVKFTIEAIMDPENGSENAPNFEDVEEITVPDDKTVVFRLSAPNVAFLDYMTMAILPQHLLQGKDMQESDFFRHPVGTGPYKLESWDAGQSIVLVKNEDYYLGAPKIDRIIFKIVTDDNAQALQLKSGEIDLALLDPKNAKDFTDKEGYTCYDMTTADYRGILFNFWNDYWTENRDLIPAICYGIDRQALPPFRAEEKPLVERAMDLIQDSYKSMLRGRGVIGDDVGERWATDYRQQAILTLDEYTAIVIHTIIALNKGRVLTDIGHLPVDAPNTPAQLWKWLTDQGKSTLLDVDADELYRRALPRASSKLTRKGIVCNGLRYLPERGAELTIGGKIEYAYDPQDTSHIYVVGKDKRLIPCTLAPSSSRYDGYDMADVAVMRREELEREKAARQTELEARVAMRSEIERIIRQAEEQSPGSRDISEIQQNRAHERRRLT